jgi:hypothetical protein
MTLAWFLIVVVIVFLFFAVFPFWAAAREIFDSLTIPYHHTDAVLIIAGIGIGSFSSLLIWWDLVYLLPLLQPALQAIKAL